MAKKLELEEIILIGRSFEEYYKMFELAGIAKDNMILDVASGVSSFAAEANRKGYNVTALDIIYGFSPYEIEKKCAQDLKIVKEQLKEVANHYQWEFFKDITDYEQKRKMVYKKFIADFKENGHHRYINAELPKTQFKDKQFTISLVSHFLFLYDEHLNYEFHKKTISELIRITSDEIRIFPLVNLEWKKSAFIDNIMDDSEFNNHRITVNEVDYEFAKKGNEILKIEIKSQ